MALNIADRVQETTSTQGTGTVLLSGAVTGYQSFAAIGNSNTTYYTIADQAGANWEVGIGTYYSANTSLARTTILVSSNSNAAVNFGVGVKNVFVTYPAEKAIYSDANNVTTITNLISANAVITGGTINNTSFNNVSVVSANITTANVSSQLNLTNASNYNLYASGAGNNYMAGALGIGSTSLTGINLRLSKNQTGGTNTYGIYNDAVIQSDATGTSWGIYSAIGTAAASFTVSDIRHIQVGQGTFGAGSAVTTQFGISIAASLTGATNNYAFYGNIAAATGRYNLYMAGTADNYLAGSLGIGAVPAAYAKTYISGTYPSNGFSCHGIVVDGTIASTASTYGAGILSSVSTENNATVTPIISSFYATQGTITGGSRGTVTTQIGAQISSGLTGATNNYAFSGALSAATGRYNLYMSGTADNYIAGSLGIGAVPAAGTTVTIAKNLTGSTGVTGVWISATVQSDATTNAFGFRTNIATAAAAFTLSDLVHFYANQSTIGATSAVTNQYGLLSANTLTGATNNYAFYGQIAAATGRYNLYMAGTANNYLAGSLGIGSTSLTGINLYVGKTITGATSSFGIAHSASVQSDVTSNAYGMNMSVSTAAAAFTLTNLYLTRTTFGGLGAGSAVTNMYGYYAESTITGATNNYGFYGNIAAATGRYNLYMGGTAQNLFSGDVLIFGAGGLGYTTGSGGAVTQATSRTTGVTLNKTNGAITLVSAAGSATYQSFTVTNSTVAATDTIIVNQKSGTDKYIILVTAVAAGSFNITFATTGGTTTEQPVFNFAVIKAVTA